MYDHIKTKYQSNAKLCYMDTDSFVIYIKTENFYEDIDNDVENMFDTSNYSPNINRPLSIRRNKKVLGKMKDEFVVKDSSKRICSIKTQDIFIYCR